MNEKETEMITREFLETVNFRVMTNLDRGQGFCGVMSPVALIGETGDYLVIVDGDYCEVYVAEPTGDGTFEPIAICENIRELPY